MIENKPTEPTTVHAGRWSVRPDLAATGHVPAKGIRSPSTNGGGLGRSPESRDNTGMSFAQPLPVIRRLSPDFCLQSAFHKLCSRPGCLWLDSSSAAKPGEGREEQGRLYSFLTADPVRSLVASPGDADPWPILDRWCRELPSNVAAGLPPFQGGLAGLIGYEAAGWLEPVGMATQNDLPTAAIAIGLYDWTIAVDHQTGNAWLISQGLDAARPDDRVRRAGERADLVESWLSQPPVAPSLLPPPPLGRSRLSPQHPTHRAGVTSNFSSEAFRGAVADIVRRIRNGDSFQVNIAQRLLHRSSEPSPQLYQRLRHANPAPFSGYFDAGDFQVLSSSPEGFLRVRDRQVETRPIKGTTPRTGNPLEDAQRAEQLLSSGKDRAENIMIVDLMRNDLSRVCDHDSVRVTKLCEIETYAYVQHLVSAVQGRLHDDASIVDLLKACFPGGSITGAPKVEAMRTIAQLEPNPRGPYCGTLGYISCGGAADFNILIRTITAGGGYWQIPVGGGITAQSHPETEEAETWTKAEGMLRALAVTPAQFAESRAEPTRETRATGGRA